MLKSLYLELWPGFCSIDEVEVIEVEVRNRDVFFRCYDLGHIPIDDGYMEQLDFDSEQWLERFEKLKIHRWKKEYWDESIIDGLCWSVDYQKEGWKITRHFSGNGGYPENWSEFIELLDELKKLIWQQ